MAHLKAHRLARLAQGDTDADAAAHVDGCAECRTALTRVSGAVTALREASLLEPPQPSPAAEVRAEANIRWTRTRPVVRRSPHRLYAGLAATAALAVLTLWATRDWSLAPADRAPVHVAASKLPPVMGKLEALVTIVGGEVKIGQALKTARPLDLERRLGAGDKLMTAAGGRVAAQWSEGSGFLLLGDSSLALARLEARTQRLALERGKLSVRVGPHQTGESLQVSTPGHVVTVHGTWFNVAAAAHMTTVEVLEGTVEVTERDGSSSTLLHAPVRAVFGPGHTLSTPLSGHEAARLRAEAEMNLLAWPGLQAARAASGSLLVASRPPAQLAIDGVEIGPTTLMLRQPLGRHYVELTRAGFMPLHQWVIVGPEPGELRAAMIERPAAPPDTAPVEIESMVRRRSAQIRSCYERRLKHDPGLAGTVSLKLEVGGAGQVRAVSVEESTLPDPLVAECLRREAAGWSFAQGRNATVVYPFVFRPQ